MSRLVLVALVVAVVVPEAPAVAQTVSARAATAKPVLTAWAEPTSSTTPAATDEGAYERLSTANRTIARAIFESQRPDGTGSLTLDQIAAMKPSGHGGWSRLYNDLYARGLVIEKTLAQAVSRYNREVNIK